MPAIGTHRRPASPVPPPMPVGCSTTATVASTCLPHQMNQAKFAAVADARAQFCCAAPAATAAATTTTTH